MNNLAAIINEQGLLPLTTIIKISIAFILGGIIGLERESKGKPVGFKTCVILSVASCVLTVVSIQSAEYYAEISMNIRSDPMRLRLRLLVALVFSVRESFCTDTTMLFLVSLLRQLSGHLLGWESPVGPVFIFMLFLPRLYFYWQLN